MAINKQNWNSIPTPNSSFTPGFGDILSKLKKFSIQSQPGRVIDVILDENHPRFNEYGWNGIGRIVIENTKSGNSNLDTNLTALPLLPHLKTYPLIDEIVLLFSLPNQNIGNEVDSQSFYYLPLNLWNHPHHNAYPNFQKNQIFPEDGPLEINLNSPTNNSQGKFIEKGDLRPLLAFCGDSIYEGRFGNSIRIGNTCKSNSTYKNNWSEGSQTKEGDPLIIIRNGQKESKEAGFIPITENINEDPNSLYFTSTQKIPFKENIEDKFNQKTNWKFRPISPKNFDKSQIIGNSDRILFNAKTDSLLFGAQKNINFSCIEDVNINSRNLYTDYNNIKLGGKDATESLIKGDLFLDNLEIVLNNLSVLCDALQSSNLWPVGIPVPNNPVITTSINLKSSVEGFVNQINSYKSKISKTI